MVYIDVHRCQRLRTVLVTQYSVVGQCDCDYTTSLQIVNPVEPCAASAWPAELQPGSPGTLGTSTGQQQA